MREACHVADQFCTAAANFTWAFCRGVCYRCGLPVCAKCSTRRKYLHYGRMRICNDCQTEIDGNDNRVLARIYRMAGYKTSGRGGPLATLGGPRYGRG